jgi:predicted porin
MKEIVRHAVWWPVLLFAAGVHAQSSVTLSGLLDQGVNFTNNAGGHSAWQMKSGDTFSSKWGLSGTDGLGDGDSVVFKLSSSFNAAYGGLGGGGTRLWQQSYVGLASERYGTLTFGRQYESTQDFFSGFTGAGNWAGDVASHPFDNDNADEDFAVNNSIKYMSPTYGGFSFGGMYAFSNAAGQFADNRLYSAGAQYQNGGLTAGAAYLKMDHPGMANGAVTNDSVFTASSQQTIGAGLSYRFDRALVAFAYSHVDVYDPTGSSYLPTAATQPPGGSWKSWKFDNFEANGQFFFRPDFWLGASYTYTRSTLESTTGRSEPRWQQIALMLDYDLSKRTSLYLQGAYQHVQHAGTGTGFDVAQNVASAGAASGANQMVYRAAMIHRF